MRTLFFNVFRTNVYLMLNTHKVVLNVQVLLLF